MVTTLRVEDRLDCALNFRVWKTKVLNILEENDLEEYVNRVILKPTYNNGKENHKKNQAKEKRILIDSVKYHLIPHISQLKIAKEEYDALTYLFEMNNPRRKRALRRKLRDIKMMKVDTVTTFFMKILFLHLLVVFSIHGKLLL